ncbi:zinc metallopeptidase [Candidatus Sororendozoicomonas aggregata]|uniref:zinc metallopeptidase n=1 Tax=Candidatus Sororendozoicomonas aggregata TaxID=3073239 RepID=UPI002ED4170C
MGYIVLGVVVVLLVFGPQWYVRQTLHRHSAERKDLQGTGGELAEHLIGRFDLSGVSVAEGGVGEDFYDPKTKRISLSPGHYHGKSIAAVAVAAHEACHALQHKEQHKGFMRRQQRITMALWIERFSALALMLSPVLFIITRIPQSTLLTLVIGLTGLLASLWVQLMNLPVELDASFNKALPLLEEGYLAGQDIPNARKVLKAAAYTYVASAMASLLNIGRWITILRR